MRKEEWKPIVGYEGLYMVSNMGRVKSLNYNHTGTERVLKPAYNTYGYLFVTLCKDGKKKNCLIHRLVAEAFLDNPHNYPEVNHKDENKENNAVSNLEYCTSLYNNEYSKAKPVLQLTLDGQLVQEWPSTHEAARQGGFNRGNISNCCLGKYKTHGGYVWKYKEVS